MKIGKREILVNPNARKFACMLAIMTGWFMWPKESDYVKYERRINAEVEAKE